MNDVVIFTIGLVTGMFLGLLLASLCAVSKQADEAVIEFDEINKEMLGSMEDDGR